MSDFTLALLRETLPEFLGSLSAMAVTAAAVFRTARAALRRWRTESPPPSSRRSRRRGSSPPPQPPAPALAGTTLRRVAA
ncbi:hypothetical protein [Streptomyces sp. PBH53]|uniref:hypothetical protein n=1 Tax=Streptomyces sp. PBH53 TaxID=1577075 RepID=UPI001AD810D8|nr:hypothetical protein [Streptomyces sp. PBH53]